MISSALVTVGFASDNGQKDLSSRLMNHDNCLLNRVSVVVREGIMSYRSMQGAELARVQQVDRHSLKITYSGGVHKTPIVIQLKENNGRFSGHVDTVRGPITLLECD
jgi:hypothetical protein